MNSSSNIFTGLTLLDAVVSHLVAGVNEGRVAAGEDVGHHPDPEAPEVALLMLVSHKVLLAFTDGGLNHLQGHELGAPTDVPGLEHGPRAEV